MFEVTRIEKDQWQSTMAENAHLSVFSETFDPKESKLDYALLVVKESAPVIYATVKELSASFVSIEYGGSFPDFRGSFSVYPAFVGLLEYLRPLYTSVCMMIRNDNFEMLKFALKAKFKITGLSLSDRGGLLTEQTLHFD